MVVINFMYIYPYCLRSGIHNNNSVTTFSQQTLGKNIFKEMQKTIYRPGPDKRRAQQQRHPRSVNFGNPAIRRPRAPPGGREVQRRRPRGSRQSGVPRAQEHPVRAKSRLCPITRGRGRLEASAPAR